MRAGKLSRRVEIQILAETDDGYGEPIKAWTTVYTVYAQVLPMRGDERAQNQQLVSRADTKFRIRHNSDMTITTKHRLVYDGDNYDITAILEIGRKEGLEIMAHKVE